MSRDLCAALKKMADNLAPSQELVSEVQRVIDRVTRYLHNPRFSWSHSINRIVPHGSFAKKTSLRIMMDLDLVIFLNDIEFPFESFVDALHDYILLNDSYEDVAKYGTLLVFVAEKTLHVDIILATNRVPRNEHSRGQKAQKLQRDETLRFIENSDDRLDEGWKQSSGLAETTVEFVKLMNERYHASTMARLAKFWSKTVCIEEFHSGRSSIMEYIAIRAAEIEQSDGREKTLKSFRQFLTLISKPEKLSIYWTDFYCEQDIDPQIKRQRPLIVDPRNPYHNILHSRDGRKQAYMKEMAQYAQVSMERLEIAESRVLQGEMLDMRELFKPQPEWCQLPFNVRRSSKKPGRFHVSVVDGGNLVMPKSTINSQNINNKEREVVENFLFSFSEMSLVNSKKKGVNVADGIQRDVQDMIAPNASWGPGPEPMNTDAKLEIPFDDEDGRKKVLKVQFDMA